MPDLTSLGYPEGYHLGFSAILWWISIVVIAILGIKLYLNAKKSHLINVKEMLRVKSFSFFCMCICFSLIQVGVFFPDNFLLFYLFGVLTATSGAAFYIYYWEKNLTSIKRIPTLSGIAAAIVTLTILIIYAIFPDLSGFLLDFLIFIVLFLIAVAAILYIYLIYIFSRNVKGVSTRTSRIWMGGMILILVALFLENPPGVKVLPAFIVLYFPPIGLMIGQGMAFYGVNKLFAQISSYYAQTRADPEIEKEWKSEQVLEPKKGHKPKNNTIKKGK